jgi:sulfate transport system permease protein
VTLSLLSLIVLIPLSAVAIKASGLGFQGVVAAAFTSRALHAYAISFGAALAAALVNGVFGVLTAWALVRYRFFGTIWSTPWWTCPSPCPPP